MALGTALGDGGLHLLHVIELAVGAIDVLELTAHEPHLVKRAVGQPLDHAHVLLMAAGAQLAHLAQDGHLGRYLHQAEVVECCCHRRRVGIVGVHHQVVVFGLGELRAVVRWHIVLECVAYLLRCDVEVQAHGHRGQHVVQIIAADEVCCHFVPVVVHATTPLQAQERVAGDDLSVDTGLGVGLVTRVALSFHSGRQDAHQVFVVGVDKDDAALTFRQVVIELALGADHPFQ